MAGRVSLRRARSVMSAEMAAIRRRDPDLDAGDITTFTVALLIRAIGVLAVGLSGLRGVAARRVRSYPRFPLR